MVLWEACLLRLLPRFAKGLMRSSRSSRRILISLANLGNLSGKVRGNLAVMLYKTHQRLKQQPFCVTEVSELRMKHDTSYP